MHDTLRELIRAGIERAEPFAGLRGPAFNGSYDWHSCVHAHWALLSLARLHEDEALRAWVGARLTPAALAGERALLRAEPGFELPYGRAWLLLLLTELERHPGLGSDDARALRAELRTEVDAWLAAAPAASLLRAEHGSWAFAFLLATLAARPEERARCVELRKHLDARRADLAARAPLPTDFLDLPSVVAVVDALLGDPLPALPPDDRPVEHVHGLGRVVSRLWPLALAARADPAARVRLEAELTRVVEGASWQEDFLAAHWVPQFVWLAWVLASDDTLHD